MSDLRTDCDFESVEKEEVCEWNNLRQSQCCANCKYEKPNAGRGCTLCTKMKDHVTELFDVCDLWERKAKE